MSSKDTQVQELRRASGESKRSLPVAILAGGLATRLRPITEKIAKAMVDIAGKPFIVRQLEHLREQDITDVVICVSHLGEQIEAALGDGTDLGMRIKYSWDGPKLLGTGGALKQALPLISGEQFFIYYGDSFLPVDFRAVADFYARRNLPALMTVLKNGDVWDKSNVLFENGEIREYNKHNPKPAMDYIDYGLGIINKIVLQGVTDDKPTDLADIYHQLSTKNLLAGFEVFERFYEIGSHKGLDETIAYFNGKN